MATEFQNKVYRLLKRIPRGKVTTYKHIAHALKCKAYRAVGMACNKNPFAPKVPCHRVVNSDGTLGGFARGVKAKKALLTREGIEITNNTIVKFKQVVYRF